MTNDNETNSIVPDDPDSTSENQQAVGPESEAQSQVSNSTPTDSPVAMITTTPPKKKSVATKIILALIVFVGITGLCTVGAFAYKAFTGKSTGASSPEGVIKNGLSALKSHDLIGLARQADPHEFEPFIENYSTFTKSLKKEGEILDEKKPLEAYDFSVEDLETKTVMYSDDVARVELLDGIITQRTDRSKLPKESREGVKRSETYDIADANDAWQDGTAGDFFSFYGVDSDKFNKERLESQHVFYIAVKRDGRWYASSLYTSAEYARIAGNAYGGDYGRPSFDVNERTSDGSSTSELATKKFIESIVSLDAERFIDSTAPDRFSIVYDYKKLLLKADKRNEDQSVVKILRDAVTVTDIETQSANEGKNREFVTVKSIDLKIRYSLNVKEKEKKNYQFIPYEASINASWDGKCFQYSGTYQVYEGTAQYFSTVTFPVTDAEGKIYLRSDFDEEYPDAYDLTFPVQDSAGHIYPEASTLTDSSIYHPLPWRGKDKSVVYDISGNDVSTYDYDDEDYDGNYPYTDALGSKVTDKYGSPIENDANYTYKIHRENIDDKQCYSDKDLRELPEFGVTTIKEKGKYYVTPIDTFWHYMIWAIDKDNKK
ncbi:MAG TPA: hypothetical protein PKB15_07240 [Acidimicrobiia bacterium]|nr:hypothetical protein [Acidimicrobiia bacterium]